ncbi:MAG: hypothetical protein H7A51_10220 [Akkermansiaceae bacterium]|nr:hypothetical protein [Akkermansiaceae bacterium]
MASKAALAMEGFDDLFGEKPPPLDLSIPIDETPGPVPLPSRHLESNIDALPSEPAIFGLASHQGSHPQASLNIPHLPETAPPEQAMDRPSRAGKETLAAMPTMDPPKVSIPLVRDQLIPAVEATASAAEPVPTPGEPDGPIPFAEPAASGPLEKKATTKPDTVSNRQDPAEAAEPAGGSKRPVYTDQDLKEALRPIIEPSVDKFLYTPTHGIHTYLEPMLRSTVRRAIAEQMEDASPFREVSGWDKFAWKMRALIGSRTYEDIVFDYTKRYQVEEVFLLRPQTRSLISYASHDPSRHAKPSKVQGTVKKIAAKTADKDKGHENSITWENNRTLMIRRGKHCVLAAVVHGASNAILRADLDYALRQAEERFGKTLEEESDIHLQILQPLLEGCLLIQSPAIPN